MGLVVGSAVGLHVELEEFLPVGVGGGGANGAAALVQLFVGAGGVMHEHVGEVGDHVGIVLALAGDDADAGLGAGLLFELANPEAEAGEVGSDGGHAVGGGFMGSVAPGFVPGGEHAEVAAGEHVEVRHVEEAVLAVEHGGHEEHLHGVILGVVQAKAAAGVQDGVVFDAVELVAGEEAVLGMSGIGVHGGVAVHSVGIGAGMAAHHEHEGQHLLSSALEGLLGLGEGVDEEVHALVVMLVAAGADEDAGIFGQFAAQELVHRGDHGGTVLLGQLAILAVVEDGGEVEAVGGDHVGLAAEEVAGFFSSDAAHGGEDIGFAGAHGLHGALGHHVEAGSFLRGRDLGHAGIDVDAVAAEGAAEHGGVRGEHSADEGGEHLEGEDAGAAHPFMEVGYAVDLLAGGQHLMDGGDDFAAGVAEGHGLDVVPAAGEGVDAEAFPELTQELVGVVAAVEVHQDDAGTARDLPAAEAAAKILVPEGVADGIPAGLVRFGELGVVLGVGADEEVFAVEGAHSLLRLAGDDFVDAADLVAHFPAYFEKVSA